jgi:hypothetical protein
VHTIESRTCPVWISIGRGNQQTRNKLVRPNVIMAIPALGDSSPIRPAGLTLDDVDQRMNRVNALSARWYGRSLTPLPMCLITDDGSGRDRSGISSTTPDGRA